MNNTLKAVTFFTFSIAMVCALVAGPPQQTVATDDAGAIDSEPVLAAATVDEARARAKLLHETIRGTLQIMHRDFFDEENAHAIPSSSLEDVFHELSRNYHVDVKWLVVNTDVVNVDHQPEDDFEKDAAKALAKGESSFEATENSEQKTASRYRYAGPIRLRSQCLKCHVKRRNSNEDRVAGLVISMPLKP